MFVDEYNFRSKSRDIHTDFVNNLGQDRCRQPSKQQPCLIVCHLLYNCKELHHITTRARLYRKEKYYDVISIIRESAH